MKWKAPRSGICRISGLVKAFVIYTVCLSVVYTANLEVTTDNLVPGQPLFGYFG